MNAFYEGETREDTKLKGPEVNCKIIKDTEKVYNQIKEDINILNNYQGVEFKNIAILSFASTENSLAKNFLDYNLDNAYQIVSSNKIIFDSVWRFKGLDRQVVFLVDIEEFIDNVNNEKLLSYHKNEIDTFVHDFFISTIISWLIYFQI